MYVIDGHNLIPKIPGMSLEDFDDEERLIELLKTYARVKRRRLEVFFDGAPPGQAGERTYGMIHAHFVPLGLTADEAIRRYVTAQGKAARNVTVVSSDHQVQDKARALRAVVIPSEDFARQLLDLQSRPGAAPPASVAPANLDQWYDLFGVDPRQAEKPIEPPPKPPKPAGKRSTGKAAPRKRPHHGFDKK